MDPLWLMNLTEPMTPVSQDPEPTLMTIGSTQAYASTPDVMIPKSSVRVYGSPMDPKPDITLDLEPFQLELFKGFTGKANTVVLGGRLHWVRPQTIPRDRVYCLHLFVDVSGSMGSHLRNSTRTRSDIIRDAMGKLSDILIPLVEKGMKFHISLHTFASRCRRIFDLTPVTREWMESNDWGAHFEPTDMTNLWGAARVAKEMQENEPKRIHGLPTESTYILMSDGMDTIGDEPLKEAVFDVAIGIGTSSEYDPSILRTLSRSDIEACPDETALSSTILRYGCQSYMNLANHVTLRIVNGEGSLTKTLDAWVSGSQLLFYWEVPSDLTSPMIQLQYTAPGEDATYGRNVWLDMDQFPHRSIRSSRLAVDVCKMQQTSTEHLEAKGDRLTTEDIQPILQQIKVLREKCATSSWCDSVLDGLWNTWNAMQQNIHLPALDRGLSIHSAIRQTQSNYYDTNCETLMRNYSTQAQ